MNGHYLPNPQFASDLKILKLKLRSMKGETKANELISKELEKRNYTSFEQWVISNGDILITQLEQSEYYRKLNRKPIGEDDATTN